MLCDARRFRHWHLPQLALALALVLAGHGWLLREGLGAAAPTSSVSIAPAALQLRLLTPPAPPTPAVEARQRGAALRGTTPHAAIPSAASPPPAEPAAPGFRLSSAPALDWLYQLKQGARQGLARLRWQPEGGRYLLSLERSLEGRALPAWHSSGELGAQGLSPERFASRRGERERQATNFRREQGLISFSASAALLPLPEGAQDPLSWLLQLAALAEAAPGGLREGQVLRLPVAGLNGTLQQWRFLVRGGEPLQLADGLSIPALRLSGSPEDQPALRTELWLDPARHHLPLCLRQHWDTQLRSELLLISAAQP